MLPFAQLRALMVLMLIGTVVNNRPADVVPARTVPHFTLVIARWFMYEATPHLTHNWYTWVLASVLA